jgi:hypothetical protein
LIKTMFVVRVLVPLHRELGRALRRYVDAARRSFEEAGHDVSRVPKGRKCVIAHIRQASIAHHAWHHNLESQLETVKTDWGAYRCHLSKERYTRHREVSRAANAAVDNR